MLSTGFCATRWNKLAYYVYSIRAYFLLNVFEDDEVLGKPLLMFPNRIMLSSQTPALPRLCP